MFHQTRYLRLPLLQIDLYLLIPGKCDDLNKPTTRLLQTMSSSYKIIEMFCPTNEGRPAFTYFEREVTRHLVAGWKVAGGVCMIPQGKLYLVTQALTFDAHVVTHRSDTNSLRRI